MAITILYKQKEMHSISKILQKDKLHSKSSKDRKACTRINSLI